MRKSTIMLAVAVSTIVGGCSQRNGTAANEPNGRPQTEAALSVATINEVQKKQPTAASPGSSEKQSDSKDRYTPPTAEELAPIRPEYSAELAKIDEPPEMAKKPMQVRKPASSAAVKAANVMSALGSPEKATHSQREAAINDMLELTRTKN